MSEYLYNGDYSEIKELLLGRKAVKVAEDTLTLDNGITLRFTGHEGGCSCGAGDYDLTELNGVDNIITNVEFFDDPADDYGSGSGYYKIFVFADNEKINLATFEGSDGNGYYGTGYSIIASVVK
jgi:hypothetical protein